MMVLAFGLTAQAAASPLADRVPDDALLYVGWRGSRSLGDDFDGSRLKAILDASGVRQLLGPYLTRLTQRIAQEDDEAGEGMALVSQLVKGLCRHPSAVYLGPPKHGVPIPGLAILCHAGADAKGMADSIRRLVEMAGRAPIPIQVHQTDEMVAMTIGMIDPGQLLRMGLAAEGEADSSARGRA
jgi:hypothetical protein